jgi:uncharacterized protein (TIGR02001 family)
MKNYYKTIGALAAASALVAGNASAEVEYELHTGYTNQYLFRGLDLGDDLVEVGADVATEWNGLGLSAGAWYGSFANGDNDFDELDLYGEVSKDLGFASLAVGYISYQNLRALGDDAQEVYFSASKEFFGVDFSLTYFWDIETDNDGYTELGASKGFELSPCLTLNTGATLAYLCEESEFAHLTAKVSLDWAFTETATISPFVAASWGLTSEAGNTHSAADEEFVGGTMLSVSF